MKLITAHSLKYDIVAPYKHRNEYMSTWMYLMYLVDLVKKHVSKFPG